MDQQRKMEQLAQILLDKHGNAAREVVRRRVRVALDSGDYRTARIWVDAAETVDGMTPAVAPPRSANPDAPLADILDGEVTKAVMAADDIDRPALEAMLREAAKKHGV